MDLAGGWAGRREKSFKGESIEHVRHTPLAILGHVLQTVDVEACGKDDGTDSLFDDVILLLIIHSAHRT